MLTHDSIAYNKPLLGGVRYNAIRGGKHLWLQNQWSGTADASTSTLSQDGTLVATNLATNPALLASGMTSFSSCSGEDSDDGMTLTATGSVACASLDVHDIPGSGTTIHVAATLDAISSTTTPSGRGLFVVFWSSSGAVLGTKNVGPSVGVLSVDVTVPDSASYIEVRLYAPSATGGTATWSEILVCTAADYEAMQAKNVTWFDGDSYVRGVI